MGKRASGFSGLSRFVSEAFKDTNGTNKMESSQEQAEPHTTTAFDKPTKKQKTNEGHSLPIASEPSIDYGVEKYDVSEQGLVPYYTKASQVPEHLSKYFDQRKRLFSLYSSPPGCLLDEEGWYSVTPEAIANQIAERCRCDTILDAFCGVGGNAIAFAYTCQRVIALDVSPTRLALARHNAQIYGVAHHIEFILADYRDFARSYLSRNHETGRFINVVFLSPPWGGPSYISGTEAPAKEDCEHPEGDQKQFNYSAYHLSSIKPVDGKELFNLSRQITQNIAYYLPRNTELDEIGELLDPSSEEKVEIEEEWMGSKLKALTCYFGGLAGGQSELFDTA